MVLMRWRGCGHQSGRSSRSNSAPSQLGRVRFDPGQPRFQRLPGAADANCWSQALPSGTGFEAAQASLMSSARCLRTTTPAAPARCATRVESAQHSEQWHQYMKRHRQREEGALPRVQAAMGVQARGVHTRKVHELYKYHNTWAGARNRTVLCDTPALDTPALWTCTLWETYRTIT